MADLSPEAFAAAVLKRLNKPVTPANVKAFVGWEKAEGGHWNNSARYNPLNTTQPMPGAGNTGSQGNIKVYKSWQQGVNATVQTLKNGRYGAILRAFAQQNPNALANAVGSSPWGTSASLVAQTIAGTKTPGHIPNPHVGGGGGGSKTTTTSTTSLTPDAAAQKKALISDFLGQSTRKPTAELGVRRPDSSVLDFALGVRSANADTQTVKTSKTTGGGGGASPSSGGGDQSATDFARQHLGRYAENAGSNRGSDLDILQNRFGMRGQPWCAMFATTAAAHGGASRAVRSASVAQIASWAQQRSHGYAGYFPPTRAQAGDLFIIQKNGISHTGVVDFVDKQGRIHTIEGNTSSGAVSKGVRSAGELSGVARPKYHR